MASAHIFYNSADLQSVVSMQISRIHAETQGYTTTITNMAGKNESQLLAAIQAVTDMTAVYVCTETQATYSDAGVITHDQIAEIDNCLIAASKGPTVISGTAQSNSTKTNIILASTANATNDFYNGMYIRTAGTTEVNRIITDYTGSSKTAVVADTGTAITTTEDYVVFTKSAKCFLVGDADSNVTASRVAWTTLFPTKTHPMVVKLIGGSGTVAYDYKGNVDGVTTFTQAIRVDTTATSVAAATLTDTGEFVAGAMAGKYVGIESATVGAGQVKKIISNTANVLTVEPWDVTPTGTVKYTISDTKEFCLAHIYIPLVIPTYLAGTDNTAIAEWKRMIDKYGTIKKAGVDLYGDLEHLKMYLQRGKVILDALAKGVVS